MQGGYQVFGSVRLGEHALRREGVHCVAAAAETLYHKKLISDRHLFPGCWWKKMRGFCYQLLLLNYSDCGVPNHAYGTTDEKFQFTLFITLFADTS